MSANPEVQEVARLLARASTGDLAAAALLVQQLTPLLKFHIRRALGRRVRRVVASGDLVQEVWQELWQELSAGRVWQSPQALRGWLARLAYVMALKSNRHYGQAKRGGTREASGQDAAAAEARAPGPGPEALAAAADEWDWLLAGVPDQVRAMLRLRRDGHTYPDIATRLGCHERTVRTALAQLAIQLRHRDSAGP